MLKVPTVDIPKLIRPFIRVHYLTDTKHHRGSESEDNQVTIRHLLSESAQIGNLSR